MEPPLAFPNLKFTIHNIQHSGQKYNFYSISKQLQHNIFTNNTKVNIMKLRKYIYVHVLHTMSYYF